MSERKHECEVCGAKIHTAGRCGDCAEEGLGVKVSGSGTVRGDTPPTRAEHMKHADIPKWIESVLSKHPADNHTCAEMVLRDWIKRGCPISDMREVEACGWCRGIGIMCTGDVYGCERCNGTGVVVRREGA